ncbi:hypothetical protein ACJX0J_034156, partial [Zea mays]
SPKVGVLMETTNFEGQFQIQIGKEIYYVQINLLKVYMKTRRYNFKSKTLIEKVCLFSFHSFLFFPYLFWSSEINHLISMLRFVHLI